MTKDEALTIEVIQGQEKVKICCLKKNSHAGSFTDLYK